MKKIATRKRTPLPAASMVMVAGSDAKAVQAARDAVLAILAASKSNDVILAALNAFTKATAVNATFTDCTFAMGAKT